MHKVQASLGGGGTNFNSSTQWQKQADLCEFKVSVVYIDSSRTDRYTRKTCLKKPNQNKTESKQDRLGRVTYLQCVAQPSISQHVTLHASLHPPS